MDYVRGASLAEVIEIDRSGLTEPMIVFIFKRVVNGLAYLHSQYCMHRDIKRCQFLCQS